MNEVVHTSPTIGSNVEEVVWKNVHFIMWDLGGQESLRAAWNTYYSNTEVFMVTFYFNQNSSISIFQFIILVVDSTDRERLSITKEELHKLMGHDELSKANILVFANKQDVKGCLTPAEISKHLNLQSIRNHKWQIQACCALTGEG